MNHREKRQFLIQALLKERPEYRDMRIPTEPESQRQLLRGLMNIRAPRRMDAEVLKTQDEYLQAETAAKGITDLHAIPALYLLDSRKRVLVKDSTDVAQIEEIIDRRA